MNLHRGDVWWVQLDPTKGSEINKTRPCVVVSSDLLNQRRRTVVVIPLSTSPTVRPPLTVGVVAAGREVVAVTDQMRAAAKERFAKRIGMLSEADMEAIEEAIRQVLGLS